MKQKQRCPRCGRYSRLTEHHVFPKRIFGEGGSKVSLCRDCHNDIEAEIRKMEFSILRKFAGAYVNIAKRFVHA